MKLLERLRTPLGLTASISPHPALTALPTHPIDTHEHQPITNKTPPGLTASHSPHPALTALPTRPVDPHEHQPITDKTRAS